MRKEILQFSKANNIDFISFSGRQYSLYKTFFEWMGIIPVRRLGPIVTIRNLNMGEKFVDLLNVKTWNYSLGDMELF